MQKKLQVWWVPQVPMKSFTVDVSTVEEGVKVMRVLANYDRFQFENKVKPDYCNAGGLNQWDDDSDGEGTPGWCSWFDDDTGEDDPVAWLSSRASAKITVSSEMGDQ